MSTSYDKKKTNVSSKIYKLFTNVTAILEYKPKTNSAVSIAVLKNNGITILHPF